MTARSLSSFSSLFIRAAGPRERAPTRTSVRERPCRARIAPFTTSRILHREEGRVQRYGTAKEPPPHLLDSAQREGRDKDKDRPAPPHDLVEESDSNQKKLAPPTAEDIKQAQAQEKQKDKKGLETTVEAVESEIKASDSPKADAKTDANPAVGKESSQPIADPHPDPVPDAVKAPSSQPMETVLNMPPPSEAAEAEKPPHLTPPPYVHHFDTYSLVRDLQRGGFSEEQSTTVMKTIRTILAENMDLARRGLVSKSNVENETYLFKAACSELKTEIENNRKSELDKNRTRRALLQHEVDILGQKITQESGNLKDELRGSFDDRKMTVRTEQRRTENRIQELNYKITVTLNSDAKTDVEGVRWVLTRRAALTLAISVAMILGALNWLRYMTQTQEKERAEHAELMAQSPIRAQTSSAGTQTDGTDDSGDAFVAGEAVNVG